jgi:hypothetical protein
MYCDKDSFSFDVKWKEKQICIKCEENKPRNTDYGEGYETIGEWLDASNQTFECLNEDLEEKCEGILSRSSKGNFVCPICDAETDEATVFDCNVYHD